MLPDCWQGLAVALLGFGATRGRAAKEDERLACTWLPPQSGCSRPDCHWLV